MIKCLTCENLRTNGKKSICVLYERIIVYGKLQEQIQEGCGNYQQTAESKKNDLYARAIKYARLADEIKKTQDKPRPLTEQDIKNQLAIQHTSCKQCPNFLPKTKECKIYGLIHPKAPRYCRQYIKLKLEEENKKCAKN